MLAVAYIIVQRCSSRRRRPAPASNTSWSTSPAPCVNDTNRAFSQPKPQNSGEASHTRSPAAIPSRWPMFQPFSISPWCRIGTPLGVEVEPDV